MAHGLKVWNDAGTQVLFDTSTRTSRFVGRIALAANTSSFLDVTLQPGEILFIILTVNDSTKDCQAYVTTTASITPDPAGNRIRWYMGDSAGFITYGVYY